MQWEQGGFGGRISIGPGKEAYFHNKNIQVENGELPSCWESPPFALVRTVSPAKWNTSALSLPPLLPQSWSLLSKNCSNC